MYSLPEALGTRPGVETHPDATQPKPQEELFRPAPQPAARPTRWTGAERTRAALAQLRWPLTVYLTSRLIYLVISVGDVLYKGWSLPAQASNWDGVWYLALAQYGYPSHVSHLQTTLGFFPLYPLLVWLVAHVLFCGYVLAGVLISLVGGFITTVLVQRMAAGWWGERAGRRAALFFCLFPGSIVFSMVYSEGLMLPLSAGALYALERRRWVLAGLLAACATAVGPVAFAIIPACVVAAFLELRRHGWRDRSARRSLLAPALAPLGAMGFGVFLWLWTGSPFASYTAQRYGWDERSTPLALWHTAKHLWHQIVHFHGLPHPGLNLNYVSGLVGAAFLGWALVLIRRQRPRIPAPALWWTLGITVLLVTSENVPPNPRMLICAFPALMVVAYELRGRAYRRLIAISTGLLVVMSVVSFVGTGLRP
ncbi:MAG: mannosyltransferase family protein [Solirubrobacteraceae bacterium]